ncbi:hypothetical protein FRC09_002358 [Ceratobasidium sp. 395]|nr:hypothetical protein FRC09_002358 [Ceratobasidium sp. 395]
MSTLTGAIIVSLLSIHGARAVGGAFGYATGTTGGGSAAQAIPSSTSQLISWLEDSTARTIVLDKIFDFTDPEVRIHTPKCNHSLNNITRAVTGWREITRPYQALPAADEFRRSLPVTGFVMKRPAIGVCDWYGMLALELLAKPSADA